MKNKIYKMVTVLTAVLLFFLCQANSVISSDLEDTATVEEIRQAIQITMRPVFYGRLIARNIEKQTELAEIIIYASTLYKIDPYLFTAMGFYESSFRKSAKGKMGEEGVWQIHGKAAEGCELHTLKGQAFCGARWLRNRIDYCGSVEAGLTAYISKSCKTEKNSNVWKGVHRRLKLARELRKKVYEMSLVSMND